MISIYTVSLLQLEKIPVSRKFQILEEFEKVEMESFTEKKCQTEYLDSLFLKKSILSKHFNISVKNIHLGKNKFGKPFLINPVSSLDFNVSHSDTYFICAVADSGPIGVDVEDIIETDLQTAYEFCCDSELSTLSVGSIEERRMNFYKLWTLKESYIKAIGLGLFFPPKKICFDLNNLSNVKIDGVVNDDWSFIIYKMGNSLISICSSQKIVDGDISYKQLNLRDF